MPQACRTCQHPRLAEINTRLVRGVSVRALAAEFGIGYKSVERHRDAHIPRALRKAQNAIEMSEGDRLLGELRELHETTMGMIADALRPGEPDEATIHLSEMLGQPPPKERPPGYQDKQIALKAIEVARRNIELLLRVAGELEGRSEEPDRQRRHA